MSFGSFKRNRFYLRYGGMTRTCGGRGDHRILGHAKMSERFMHKNLTQHVQQAILNCFLRLRYDDGQLSQRGRQCRTQLHPSKHLIKLCMIVEMKKGLKDKITENLHRATRKTSTSSFWQYWQDPILEFSNNFKNFKKCYTVPYEIKKAEKSLAYLINDLHENILEHFF